MVDQVFSFGELGFQEFETSKYLTGILEKNGFTVERGIAGIPTAWMATLGIGQAGDRARLGHRRHPAGVAEAGRRAITTRSSRARPATAKATTPGMPLNITAALAVKKIMEREHLSGTHQALAGRRRGAARHQGVLRARRRASRTWTSCSSRTSAPNLSVSLGRRQRQRPDLGRVHLQGRERARRRRAVARASAPRRRRADGHRLELPPRAPAAAAAVALRHHRRRRSAERRAADRDVWYYFRETDYAHIKELLGDRRHDGAGRGA